MIPGAIEALKAPIRRHWPRLRLRTIVLATFVFVAALPGFGALFLRVYENTLVRQTEAELVAQGVALAATAAADWPGAPPLVPSATSTPEETGIDLRTSPVLPERPAAVPMAGTPDAAALQAAQRLAPILRTTSRTTLASILLLDVQGRVLVGPDAGLGLAEVPEVAAALAGHPDTVLRRNAAYRPHYAGEWLSRASDLRIHHARPILVGGRIVGVLLLSRSPRALFRGIYEDRGKILLGIVLILGVLILLSGLLSRGITRPIEELSAATRAVARGGGPLPEPPTTAAVEIQALYADFATMTAAIEHRSRYLRDFAHAVSHEFKTPLAGIRGALELVQDHHATMRADERDRFLGNALADADRLSLLVSRLLDLARADMSEGGGGGTGDLTPALRRVADAHAAPGFAVELEAAAAPSVAVPEAAIEAVVAALAQNSRQAGAAHLTITVGSNAACAIVTVADDGPGIPTGDRERIFEPFFTNRRASGGTGLGLSIARSLLAAHGGGIQLADGSGARFRLVLPLADPKG